jgi:Tol biopolymer transport system component
MEEKVNNPQEPPLESWKAIAAYLKRDVRTVIRWEKAEGLPVHRQMHQARGSVFAYRSELDAWKASRELRLDKAPRLTPWRRAAEAVGFGLAVLLALGTAGGGPFVAPLRAASDEGGPGIVLRQIQLEGLERTPYAQLSPDGRRLLYVLPQRTERPADLLARELSSGSEETVVAGFGEGGFSLFRWSPDGARVVYTCKRRELRTVGSHGGESRSLWTSPDPEVVVKPLDWARDGRSILAALVDEGVHTNRLVLVPTEGGEPRLVVSGTRDELGDWARLSPDGRFVAGLRTRDGKSHVCVWASDGEQETPVTEPGTRVSPGFWSPDGQYLVFTSDRMKTQDLWAVPMRDGRPRGTPLRIKQDLGRNAVLTGFTAAGQLTMIVTGEGTPTNLFVLDVDRSTVEARGELAAYAKYPTAHMFPRWSPDGSRLAYTSRRGEVRVPSIFLGSLDGKSEEEIPTTGYYAAPVAWSPDGAQLLFSGLHQPDQQIGIFRLSLETHEVTPVHLGGRPGPGSVGAFVNLQWLPLAKRFTFDKLAGPDKFEIYAMGADGRQVERLAEVPTQYWSWSSPDGRHVAYRQGQDLKLLTLADKATVTLTTLPEDADVDVSGPAWSPDGRAIAFSDARRLQIRSPVDGAARTLVEAPAGSALGGMAWFSGIAWSPDGRYIAYLQRELLTRTASRSEIWLVPAAGGTPRRVSIAPASHPLLSDVDWHPGGTKIFVTGGTGAGQVQASYQHWVMEGFLPAAR